MAASPISSRPRAAPHQYETETFLNALKGVKPSITFDSSKWEQLAKAALSADSWGYVSGNAGTGESDKRNRDAFHQWALLPSRLVQTKYPELETTVLGQKMSYPVALAPIGVQKIFHRDGEIAAAKAAASCGLPYILSSATCTSIENAAKANEGGTSWFQLYWPSNEHNEYTVSLLRRAKAAGYTALFVTVDTYAMGWRYVDMDHGYNPFLVADHVGVENGLTDPVFQKRCHEKHSKGVEDDLATAAAEWAGISTPGLSHSWEDLSFLKKNWDGPIVLKRIQTVADAKKAVAYGMQGVVVSNHGGRQQDGVPGSLETLEAIANAVGSELDVFFDSGIRTGVDVAKALALGAKCVLIGRPYIYGLAINGQTGVEHVLKALLGEFEMTLHQAGVASVQSKDLNRSILSCGCRD
ncbi:hypothetical protein M409DRAFT_37769 [Zasmidium cellare ATCC 36951]|uniref:FMN hydroxy acid dehydrogenase domain-containing protein n=1 Tax=Zasmidium cellare ATCC 36951 TaxID=1080233 RepID=A0A6A6C0I1_ZASCE|nr:uncharacterized protein M409DRAFT_37769 [Zasmidium cellare ATCC 36951]KAF2160383.1 hypothetical protein M409DRAFT_37769 [Zasmidium cellare ATCC 36951]